MPQRRIAARDKQEESVPLSRALDPVVTEVTGGDLTLDNPNDDREHMEYEAKIKDWKESPFAVGAVGVTWEQDWSSHACCDDQCCNEDVDANCCICCSSVICGKLGAGRVGNMAVLRQSVEWVEQVEQDEETGEERVVKRYQRPVLHCVVGPYWPMLMCVTYPLILGVSLWTLLVAIPHKNIVLQLIWAVCTFGLIYSLYKTAFSDPGILYRHASPPPQDENQWRWNDQGQTYRPRGAYYDSDCAVVVEEFDHTCPWTGTAIGKKNLGHFQLFLGLVAFLFIFDIMLLLEHHVNSKKQK